MSRGRALRTGVAYDMRTGFKVRGARLIQDGESPGIWTTPEHKDELNPQRYVQPPAPDGMNYRPGPPAAHSIPGIVDLSWSMGSDTSPIDSDTMQPPTVLTRSYLPGNLFIASGTIDTPA